MRGVKFVRSLLARSTDTPILAQSLLAAFSKNIPTMHGVIIVNTLLLAATHLGSAPILLSVVVPALFCLGSASRVIVWLRRRGCILTDAEAVSQLRKLMRLIPILGASSTVWAMCLYGYGNSYARLHVLFFLSTKTISGMLWLTHLSRRAVLLAVIDVVPFALFCCVTGSVVLAAIAVNQALVVGALGFIMLRHYDDFAALITSRRELLERQAETKRLSDDNFRLANLDSLTGLPNRRRFIANMERALKQAERAGSSFAVALVDLDGFKGVNDAYGHPTGDRLLAEVGERLNGLAGPTVSFARLGGDEFGVVLTGNPTEAEVIAFGRQLCAVLSKPFLSADIGAQLSGSTGIVLYPSGGDTAERLFERADYALYHAKQAKNGEPTIFSYEHEMLIRKNSQIEQALAHADLDGEMWLAYQPITDVATGRVAGYEALARWRSPSQGAVRPDVFIPVAERRGLIGALTETLLAKALRAAADWPAAHNVSFNLSAQDLVSRQTMLAVERLVRASGIPPERIEFEITETAVMRDFDQAVESLAALRRLGARIALDDFGTGFSSLSHVHRLKPDKIKIDRSFVTDIEANKTSRDIVRTIVDLCDYLRLGCVVEGVETEAQRRILTSLGCRLMQGYLFGRPMPTPLSHLADSRATTQRQQDQAVPATFDHDTRAIDAARELPTSVG